jgi:glutamate synthase (NADPH/NADH) small chain
MTYRTSSSQEEGGDRQFALMTTHLSGKDGSVQALHAVRVEPELKDGRMTLKRQEGAELTIPCDLVILAMGFVHPVAAQLSKELGVELDRRGNVAVDAGFRTNVPGVYAAGDARKGASLIVWAISDGRECARTVDADLRVGSSVLPTRGIDQPFEAR